MTPTRAELVGLLTDIETFLVDIDSAHPNALRIALAVDNARAELEKAEETPTVALLRWLDENVSKCGHGYVFVTCARCVIDQGGLR